VWQTPRRATLGRAGFAVLTRFVGPVVVGAIAFPCTRRARPATYVLFACSMLLATIVCFGCRFLVNAAAYWLLDARGPQVAWTLLSAVLGGLYFPLWFLPARRRPCSSSPRRPSRR
jgi:ABC-2 type transport system permease protein